MLAACCASGALAGEPHLTVGDPVYERIDRLAALGLIPSSLPSTRPLSRDAMAALLAEARERAGATPDPWIEADLLAIEQRAAMLGVLRDTGVEARIAAGARPPVPVGAERAGDRISNGMNTRLGADLGGSLGALLAWGYRPGLRYPMGESDDLDLVARAAYGTLVGAGLAVTIGRESMWWGPGFRGALLLTDNAAPFDLVRVETDRPVRLPWVGPLSAHLFVTRLESDRLAIPHPYLAGLRLVIRPWSRLEFGLSRTAMFGGEGRPVTLDLIWDVIRARGENSASNPGNQIAGFDATVRIPWRAQPVALYVEWAGEDEANGWPSHPAAVVGAYLPRILGSPRWTLRAEAADDALADVPGIWYRHALYRSGYTYKGAVIGHPMGTDARMTSVELTHRVTPDWSVAALYDGLQRNVYAVDESSGRSLGARISRDQGTDVAIAEYRYARFEDPTAPHRSDHLLTVSYRRAW
ncbi:MAG TPA: capsule assembly Wzi family protein [Nitrospiria bacterium]|nr:capsule assembly Wzi family protein [Nitrospiria bacterium]